MKMLEFSKIWKVLKKGKNNFKLLKFYLKMPIIEVEQ